MRPLNANESSSSSNSRMLRKACDECNSAKVKCSGQRAGCDRCRANTLTCVYGESRVGKVPGVRAKNRRSQIRSNSTRADGVIPSPPATDPSSVLASSYHGELRQGLFRSQGAEEWSLTMAHEPNQSALNAAGGMFDGPFEMGTIHLEQSMHPSVEFQSLSNTDHDLLNSDMDFGQAHDQSSIAPSSIPDPTESPTIVDGSSSTEDTRYEENVVSEDLTNSQCVIACASVITNLEKFIEAQVELFDMAIDVVRKSLSSLSQIIDYNPTSQRCRLLLTVILDQIVQTLERIWSNSIEQPASSGSGNSKASHQPGKRSNMFSTLPLGDFQISAMEQRAFKARLVLKETRLASKIWQDAKGLASQANSTMGLGHTDMDRRLNTLVLHFQQAQNAD